MFILSVVTTIFSIRTIMLQAEAATFINSATPVVLEYPNYSMFAASMFIWCL